jgi:hypothetical protein
MGVTFLNRMGMPVRTFYMQLAGAGSTNFGGRGKKEVPPSLLAADFGPLPRGGGGDLRT